MSVTEQFQNNLGKAVVLNRTNKVDVQYGKIGAEGNFAEVFDSPTSDPSDTQLRIYNIMTWLGAYTMPGVIDEKLAIVGKLTWGIGGATFEADFDWKMGTQISIAASFVRVAAAYSEVGTDTPAEVKVGAMMSSGSRAARSQVTRSYPRLNINNSTVLFPIPPYAHALNLFANETAFYTGTNVQVRYVSYPNNGFSTAATSLVSWTANGPAFLSALANEDGVRFPECARFVEVSTANDYNFTPCFTLSL